MKLVYYFIIRYLLIDIPVIYFPASFLASFCTSSTFAT